ncbi:MAG TPA: OmpA family protein [Bacteroidales bacterium]
MKSIVFLIASICFSIPLLSQTYNSKYSENIEETNEYLQVNEFDDALPLLLKLEKDGYDNGNICYKLGQCYLNSVKGRGKSISYLQKASEHTTPDYKIENTLERNAPLRAILLLGDAYRVNNRLKEAEQTYKKYLSLVKDDDQEKTVAEKRIFEVQMAQLFMKRPSDIKFDKLLQPINSGLGNFNACISGDGKSLVFNRKMKFYDAIFYSTFGTNGWSNPVEITTNLGSDGEFHPTGLSPDGKRMLLTSYNLTTGYDIYESVFKDGKWRKVKILNNSVNSSFYDIDAVYGPDGKSIYFSSNRTTGFGGFDLYMVPIDNEGNIGLAQNLGNNINTQWDEKSPALIEGGDVLVFSSQRKPGMGGFDFFYAKRDANGKFGDVYNVGYPLSTVNDDLGLSTEILNSEGVIAIDDPLDVISDADIYKVRFGTLSKFKLVPVIGDVSVPENKDVSSFKGLSLYFIDETIHDTVGVVSSPEGGKYRIDLYPGDFRLVMDKGNNNVVSQSFTVPSNEQETGYQLISEYKPGSEKSVSGGPAGDLSKEVTDTVFVTDILFEFDKSFVSLNEKENIARLVTLLRNHKIDRIELIGHTDPIGKKVYNQSLSERRAWAVKDVFERNGIAHEIITTSGLGNAVQVAKNINTDGSDNPSGRAYNRRVEIHIISSDKNLLVLRKNTIPAHLKP